MQKIAGEIRQAMGQVTTKSFLNPLLWLCALVTVPSFIVSAVLSGPMQIAFFIVGLLPILLVGFMVLKYQDRPELFQSEEYRLKDKALRIYGDSSKLDGEGLGRIIDGQAVITHAQLQDLRREG